MKKKIVSLLLTAVMAVSLAVPSVVWAGEEEAAASEETVAETGAEVHGADYRNM